MYGIDYMRNSTTVGSQNYVTMAKPRCREIDKRKQAVDLEVAGEVSSSGRMASVGRDVAECSVRIESGFRL